jgi:hypothetical protein
MDFPEKSSSDQDNNQILLELLRKEQGYYLSILEIAKEESKKVSMNEPFKEIKPLLNKKKILLTCIGEIEKKLTPLKKYWQGKTDRSDVLSKQIKDQLDALNEILKEILRLDSISQKTLEAYYSNLQKH